MNNYYPSFNNPLIEKSTCPYCCGSPIERIGVFEDNKLNIFPRYRCGYCGELYDGEPIDYIGMGVRTSA